MGIPCYVYVISWHSIFEEREKAYIKVGLSSSPASRLQSIQTGSPLPLMIHQLVKLPSRADAEVVERRMHEALEWSRSNGEWFYVDPVGLVCTLSEVVAFYWLSDLRGGINGLFGWFEQIGYPHTEEYIADLLKSNGWDEDFA